MAKTQDYTKLMQEMMGAFPLDMRAFDEAFRTTATLNGKFARVALEAAEKSAEISTAWTRDTIAKLADLTDRTAAREDAADYGKAMTEFASTQAELVSENLAAFAEVAKKVQTETVELMLTAGRELGEEARATVKKATAGAKAGK